MQNAQKLLFPNLVYELAFMLNAFMGSLCPKDYMSTQDI